MQNRYCFEAVDRMLQDIRDCARPFGGIPVILGGDFAQILPVVPRGSRADIVAVSLRQSYLWSSLRLLSLRLNMRVRIGEDNQRFADWIRRLLSDPRIASSVRLPN